MATQNTCPKASRLSILHPAPPHPPPPSSSQTLFSVTTNWNPSRVQVQGLLLQDADSSLTPPGGWDQTEAERRSDVTGRERGGDPDGVKPVREGGGGRKEGAIVQPRGDLPGDPHPGGHSNSSSGTAQNGGHGRELGHAAEWPSGSVQSCRDLGTTPSG